MNSCYNIPAEQRRVQQLVTQFNAEEEVWLRLKDNRRLRRRLCPDLSEKNHRQLDLLEYAAAQPPQDCIGFHFSRKEHKPGLPQFDPSASPSYDLTGQLRFSKSD
jgi:hypothetical protein